MTNKTRWVLDVKEDPKTGDSMLEFPADLLASTGWREGDILEWKDLGNGSWSLTKQETDVTIEEEEAWRELESKIKKA